MRRQNVLALHFRIPPTPGADVPQWCHGCVLPGSVIKQPKDERLPLTKPFGMGAVLSTPAVRTTLGGQKRPALLEVDMHSDHVSQQVEPVRQRYNTVCPCRNMCGQRCTGICHMSTPPPLHGIHHHPGRPSLLLQLTQVR
jgi:hypothetical protein